MIYWRIFFAIIGGAGTYVFGPGFVAAGLATLLILFALGIVKWR